ncbi:MAG: hypothetical protein MK106_13865 [Mariniblastus sp.]|nr:hypothetical protein [Mariniblastus sp.]
MSAHYSVMKKVTAVFTGTLLCSFVVMNAASADVLYDAFVDFEVSDGEQGWGDFTGQYTDAHQPDQTGPTSSILLASPAGGIVTSTGNLYSMSTVPTYNVQVTSVDNTEDYTSVALQVATSSSAYTASSFALGGAAPDEFANYQYKDSGGFTYQYYRAEWTGLNASSFYSMTMTGAPFAVHQSLAAARVDYVNTSDSSYNMQSVPEPAAFSVMVALCGLAGFRRRR